MKEADVLSLDGTAKSKIELPEIFELEVRPELILRAVLAENSSSCSHRDTSLLQVCKQQQGTMEGCIHIDQEGTWGLR